MAKKTANKTNKLDSRTNLEAVMAQAGVVNPVVDAAVVAPAKVKNDLLGKKKLLQTEANDEQQQVVVSDQESVESVSAGGSSVTISEDVMLAQASPGTSSGGTVSTTTFAGATEGISAGALAAIGAELALGAGDGGGGGAVTPVTPPAPVGPSSLTLDHGINAVNGGSNGVLISGIVYDGSAGPASLSSTLNIRDQIDGGASGKSALNVVMYCDNFDGFNPDTGGFMRNVPTVNIINATRENTQLPTMGVAKAITYSMYGSSGVNTVSIDARNSGFGASLLAVNNNNLSLLLSNAREIQGGLIGDFDINYTFNAASGSTDALI
ncbi:MAG: hypothetical protein QM527_12460 [Alphaproteobacteria bacterium]|nr:hypothetical protein [Alphaproteobacteria bacterium]